MHCMVVLLYSRARLVIVRLPMPLPMASNSVITFFIPKLSSIDPFSSHETLRSVSDVAKQIKVIFLPGVATTSPEGIIDTIKEK